MRTDQGPLVAVSYRIRPTLREWLAREAREVHERSANWLVNRLLEEARAKSLQGKGATQ